MLPRPIMMPSTPYFWRYSSAFSGVSMSPLPKTGMFILGFSRTSRMRVQSASPLYIWERVRP